MTKMNPIYWKDGQSDGDRWYLTPEELAKDIKYGNFDKMLVIESTDGKVDFPGKQARSRWTSPSGSCRQARTHMHTQKSACGNRQRPVVSLLSSTNMTAVWIAHALRSTKAMTRSTSTRGLSKLKCFSNRARPQRILGCVRYCKGGPSRLRSGSGTRGCSPRRHR